MIREIILSDLDREFNSIPPVEEIKKMYRFSELHNQRMEVIFAELRRRERLEGYFYTLRKIAIVVLVTLALAFVSLKFIPEVYAYVKAWLVELKEDRMEFRNRGSESDVTDVEALEFELGYVPEGYELVRKYRSPNGTRYIVDYQDYAGEVVRFDYCDKVDGALVSIDTDSVLTDEVDVGDIHYYLFESADNKVIIAWEQEEYLFTFSGCIDKGQAMDVVKSIVFIQDK